VQARKAWAGIKLGLSIRFSYLKFKQRLRNSEYTRIYDKELESMWGNIIVAYFTVLSWKAAYNLGITITVKFRTAGKNLVGQI
jgi:hypothetical protein